MEKKKDIIFNSPQPVSLLCRIYQVAPYVLERICGDSIDDPDRWALGYSALDPSSPSGIPEMKPTGEMAEKLAAFFVIDINDLKAGNISPYPLEEVQAKVKALTVQA